MRGEGLVGGLAGALACAALLAACVGRSPLPREAPSAHDAGPVIEIERTACFGECPVYRARAFADGRVEWEGIAFVALEGEDAYGVPSATVERLLERAEGSGFFLLEPSDFVQRVVDGADIRLRIARAGREHAIRVSWLPMFAALPDKRRAYSTLAALAAEIERELDLERRIGSR